MWTTWTPTSSSRMRPAGMTAGLDPYTVFISEEDMDTFQLLTTGRYGGVGSLIRKSGDGVVFAEPYKGSPADRAGIVVGDPGFSK